jgi:hypothetical protein
MTEETVCMRRLPSPGFILSDATPTIKAIVKGAVTNLSRTYTKLCVAGKAISQSSFKYDRAKNWW